MEKESDGDEVKDDKTQRKEGNDGGQILLTDEGAYSVTFITAPIIKFWK